MKISFKSISQISVVSFWLVSVYALAQEACLQRMIEEAQNMDSIQWSTGTGFLIDDSGYILTNRHVIERARSLDVTFLINNKKVQLPAKVIEWFTDVDLALLKADVSGLFHQPLPYGFSKQDMSLGQKVYTLGFPKPSYLGENIKLTDGIISATSGFQDDENMYQISAPIQAGNSGSPIFDSNGNVRGVVVASFTGGQNVNYAIKGIFLDKILKMKGVQPPSYKAQNTFVSRVGEIQSRICLVQISSLKFFYEELEDPEDYFSREVTFLNDYQNSYQCDLKEFLNSEVAGNLLRKSKGPSPAIQLKFNQLNNTAFGRALFISYYMKYHWNLSDAMFEQWVALDKVKAYENIYRATEKVFKVNSHGIRDHRYFGIYVEWVLPRQFQSLIEMHLNWDNSRIQKFGDYLDGLMELSSKDTDQFNRLGDRYYEEIMATLATYRLAVSLHLREGNMSDHCIKIAEIKVLNPDADVEWLNVPCR